MAPPEVKHHEGLELPGPKYFVASPAKQTYKQLSEGRNDVLPSCLKRITFPLAVPLQVRFVAIDASHDEVDKAPLAH